MTLTDRELMQLALDCLETPYPRFQRAVISALRDRLARRKRIIVSYLEKDNSESAPSKSREWSGLTDDEIKTIYFCVNTFEEIVRATERTLKAKNT